MGSQESFIQIKPNVWKWTIHGREYSVKKYDSLDTAYKIRRIHHHLASVDFPYTLPLFDVKEENAIVQPWVSSAKPANFASRKDRQLSLGAIRSLHQTSDIIKWEEKSYLKNYDVRYKWKERLQRYTVHQKEIAGIIGEKEAESIRFYAENALERLNKTVPSKKERTLLHGDVVHHNFLKQGDEVILIDFDLACLGPEEVEMALWMHRVLPHVDYRVEFLLEEQPTLKFKDPSYMFLLLYPNELLREWLYIISLPTIKRQQLIPRLKMFTAKALTSWPKLWYDVEKIVRRSI